MKLLGVRWFSGAQCVGIVRVEQEYEGTVYYIGPAMGGDPTVDVDYIMGYGARFPQDAGDLLFGVDHDAS